METTQMLDKFIAALGGYAAVLMTVFAALHSILYTLFGKSCPKLCGGTDDEPVVKSSSTKGGEQSV